LNACQAWIPYLPAYAAAATAIPAIKGVACSTKERQFECQQIFKSSPYRTPFNNSSWYHKKGHMGYDQLNKNRNYAYQDNQGWANLNCLI
jgi:hypothetical protein